MISQSKLVGKRIFYLNAKHIVTIDNLLTNQPDQFLSDDQLRWQIWYYLYGNHPSPMDQLLCQVNPFLFRWKKKNTGDQAK